MQLVFTYFWFFFRFLSFNFGYLVVFFVSIRRIFEVHSIRFLIQFFTPKTAEFPVNSPLCLQSNWKKSNAFWPTN